MKNSKGFTFIELLIVISLVLLVTHFSSIFYSRFLTSNSVSNNANQLVHLLRKAQLYSMVGRQNGGVWGVKYTASPKKLTLYLNGSSSFDESFDVNSNITITGLTTPVTFAHLTGLPSSSPTITITGNNVTETITITTQGIINK